MEPEPTGLGDSNDGPDDSGRATHTEYAQPAPSDISDAQHQPAAEVKTVGNAMRFRPLSVANKKKKPVKKIAPVSSSTPAAQPVHDEVSKEAAIPAPPKPKVSLFGVTEEGTAHSKSNSTSAYEPLMDDNPARNEIPSEAAISSHEQRPTQDANSLDTIASDLNLSAADRRRLFGRNGKGDVSAINVANFNMDNEYAKNEQLRAAGETVEHRAVKAVAPGKHSLQQLVNSANTQREALEDAWAEGKRNRGEAGNKYGWAN